MISERISDNIALLRARRNEKQIQETKICYLESQQKALLKFNKKLLKTKLSFTISNGK